MLLNPVLLLEPMDEKLNATENMVTKTEAVYSAIY